MTASSKTTRSLVEESLREVGIIRENQTVTNTALQRAISKLNEMASDWEADGIELNWIPVDDGADILPIDETDERALRYNLALELAGSYGAPIPEVVTTVAFATKRRLEKSTTSLVECDVSHLPGTNYRYNIETDE